MSQPQKFDDTTLKLFQLHAESLIQKYHEKLTAARAVEGTLPTASDDSELPEIPAVNRVAIVGAGVSGLRLAMKLGLTHKVDVYEASDRVGGRLYTYKFESGGKYDYFDVGAMRFPKTKVMDPTYRLFDELAIPLLEYHMETKESWMYYNGIRVRREDAKSTDFDVSIQEGGNVPEEWVKEGVEQLMDNVYARFLHYLRSNYKAGYELLMKYDSHSTRSFMAFVEMPELQDSFTGEIIFSAKKKYPTEVINWLETMTFSVGWFDRAFAETILELLAFAEGQPDVKWRCVDGGSQVITDTMKEKLENDDTYKQNVTIKLLHQTTAVVYDPKASEPLTVSGRYQQNPKVQEFTDFPKSEYSHVILAISPQCMRYIDLSTCQLDYGQKSSLLMLQPGPSTKVGMKFKTNWWSKQGIQGGQSTTDRPVRTVVYPSHGDGKSTVLIASYCWTQDAAAMGCLMQGKDSPDSERLRLSILRDLSDIHNIPLSELEEEFQDWFPFDWNHNPKTMGAYAFFGPGQFSSLYVNMSRPAAQGRLYFAGEAVSTCHAWVAGALESADRVLNMMFPSSTLDGGMQPIGHGANDSEPEETKHTHVLLRNSLLLKQLAISGYLQRA